MNNKFLMTLAITGSLILASSTALAAENIEGSFSLDPMVITAQRSANTDLNTPASVTVVSNEQIRKAGYKTVYDVIEYQVGSANIGYGPSGGDSAGHMSRTILRGLDKATLVMINGAPINMLNYNNMENIPVENVERVEIVRGANSVLYGSEAFGGVINIITKKASVPKTTVSVAGGNYSNKWSVNTSSKKINIYASKENNDAINDTNKLFTNSTKKWKTLKGNKENLFLNYNFDDNLSLNYSYLESENTRDYLTVTSGEHDWTGKGTRYYSGDKRHNASLVYNDDESQIKSILSYTKRKTLCDKGAFSNSVLGERITSKYSNWNMSTITFDTQKAWDFRENADKLIVGTTWSKEDMEDYGKAKDADRNNYALYASYKRAMNDKFDVTMGVRGQIIKDEGENQNVFTPQIQTLYKINDTASWYTNIGKSFQMPALNQYFKDGRTSKLEPQEGWSYETGLKFIDGDSSLKMDVFYMDIDGKFDWVKDENNISYLINAGKFKNNGLEVEFARKLESNLTYRLGASLSNPRTKEDDSTKWVQSSAKVQLTAGVDYTMNKLTTSLNYLYLGDREDSYYDNNGSKAATSGGVTHEVPARNLLNANFIYTADDNNSVELYLNNILGKTDTVNKYENWGAPYNWLLTYNYTF